ncbi:spastin isoform X1 [Lolium rigidum]|uniref:spastin isoform X1 n=1 Tax=Lolium rigidum TaxID=89674 RepID=UPI001F5E105E|nr:spastin isoform X1 [Lolium rigidum]
MSFLRALADSLSSLLFRSPDAQPMADAAGPAAVVGERVGVKLKGYFELAKEEIDKAVRAEEWGLPDDADAHYRNALRVMLEAKAARVPDAVSSSSERGQVRMYQEKIAKWQTQVEERLRVLGQRSGASAPVPKKVGTNNHLNRPEKPASTSSRRPALQSTPTFNRGGQASSHQKNSNVGSKPMQRAGGKDDDKLVEMINTTIVDRSPSVKWDDVAGLDKAKQALMEMVILPTKRRDLFTGLRRPAKGLLLFGPPGNGKTMLAKAVASESEATFFNVSASSLTSKWVGEAEKLVRTLFMVAVERQPSVIFMDEIDSVMSTRLASENDASRRLKSEFLIQFDGVTSNPDDLVIVIGATNKPQELDDAVLRRLVKRIYVPLPDPNVRRLLLKNQLKGQAFKLSNHDLERLAVETEGYSGSDLRALCEEAAMMPIRELGPHNILTIKANQLRPLRYEDFRSAMTVIRPSLQKSKWDELEKWNDEFGSS